MLLNRGLKLRIAVSFIILAIAAFFYWPDIIYRLQPAPTKLFKSVVFGQRVLIIAPHPDDEVLGPAGAIEKALAEGKRVKVVIMTTGDGYAGAVKKNFGIEKPGPKDFRRLGEMRHLESIRGMEALGVKKEDVIFLGYPDGGTNGLWQVNWDYSKLHWGLNGSDHSPYSFAYEKKAPYCGANVVKNLANILHDFKPTDIIYPDPNDQHHDHWAVNAFVKYVLTEQHFPVKEWTYLVHRGDFPWPWRYDPALPLNPPEALNNLDTRWLYLPMNKSEEQLKLDAVKKYVSQTRVIVPFLEAFVRTNELLGTYQDPLLPIAFKKPEFSKSGKLPFKLFLDPAGDNFIRKLEPGDDIMAVGAVLVKNDLYIGMETRAPITNESKYNIRIRFFRPKGVTRLDMSVKKGRIFAAQYAENSLVLPREATFQAHGNQLWLSIPAKLIEGSNDFLISTDTEFNFRRVDKTAWRRIRFVNVP